TTLFLAAAAVATPAVAQESGGYVSVGGGFQHRQKAGESADTYTLWKNGPAFNVAAGAGTKSGVAIEGEFSFFKNASKTTAATVTGPQPGVGDVTLKFFFANVRYTAGGSRAHLYLGGGVGG